VPRISELHYSNAYARTSGVSEFLEVAIGPSDNPADYVVGFYQADGSLGIEVRLDDPRVVQSVDPENGELIFVLSADNLPIFLTDPDGNGSTNYEAYALTNTASGEVVDFYDIGGGTQNIVAQSGAAAGAVSENLPVVVGPNATTTSIQFVQPNPDQITYAAVSPGDSGIACFVAGTRIETADGLRDISTLVPGDRVKTLDQGLMPVRWVGQRVVDGTGQFAPIRFSAGSFGARSDIFVSPQHRILISDWRSQFFFGEDEVLVPAKALIDGHAVRCVPRPEVTYVHLLFDDHQIVCANGVWSESYFPVSETNGRWNAHTEAELLALFPNLISNAFTKTVRPALPVRLGTVLSAA